MIIVSWNVRGLRSRRKRGVIKKNIKKLNPDIVILQETTREIVEERVVSSLWKARFRVGWYLQY